MKRWASRLGLGAVALGLLAAGCAEERSPINRVQPNALQKSFFVGADLQDIKDDPEFYKRDTVVDVGYGAAQDGLFTSTYAQPVSRIRWEITEGMLNARLSYERIEDTDGKGDPTVAVVSGGKTTYKYKPSQDGQIVASYAIQGHFDIRRSYNPSTGEELNVVEENASDRAWYEREYFRVDWSKNLVTDAYDFDTLSMMGIFGGISYEPLSYTVLDPQHPDAPHFEDGYFDLTNKVFATPQQLDLSSLGWGIDKFPACMLPGEFAGGTQPYGNCNPTEITLRSSFRRVENKDYEPLDYDGYRFQYAGIFTTERSGYDRGYGMVDSKWHRFASRYNIWDRSHYYKNPDDMKGEIACATTASTETNTGGNSYADPNRDENNNGTADECEAAGEGSRCDVFSQKCTLPFAKRKSVTIPWYVEGATKVANADDLFESTNWAVVEWDLAMKTSVQTARLTECYRTNGASAKLGSAAECSGKFPMWKGQQDDNDEAMAIAKDLDFCRRTKGWKTASCLDDAKARAAAIATERNDGTGSTNAIGEINGLDTMIVLCHNPVIKGDHSACGKTGLAPRQGDIRYNQVVLIDKPQQPSAWGIMVDGDDPLSGEKVAASINIWTHVTDLASQGLTDIIRYVNGELPLDQITDGKYVNDWIQANKLATGGGMPLMTNEEVKGRTGSFGGLDEALNGDKPRKQLTDEDRATINRGIALAKVKLKDTATRADIPSQQDAIATARMASVAGTELEADLMNPAMMQIAGLKNGLPLQGTVAQLASPMRMNNPKMRQQFRRMKEMAFADHGACIINEAPEASGVPGLAKQLAQKFGAVQGETPAAARTRIEAMRRYIYRRYNYAVLAHEMGHSVGLRHNFMSNPAALHFRPQYWQLRTKNNTVTTRCGKTCTYNATTSQQGCRPDGIIPGPATDDGTACVGPRYYDPITQEENEGIIWKYQQSTVMDYPGDVTQDMIGLGAYDFAAARMFYGDTVSLYTSDDYKAGTSIGVGVSAATDTFGGLTGVQYGLKNTPAPGSAADADATFTNDDHYSVIGRDFKLITNCHEVTPVQPTWWRPEVDGQWLPSLDGQIVAIDGKFTKCQQQQVDYGEWSGLRMPTADELNLAPGAAITDRYRGGVNTQDSTKRLRVPYNFATDHWADTGNTSVFRHDQGADPYEQVIFTITSQEDRHIFDNYRRGRHSFDLRAAADRSYSRYNEKLLGFSSGMAFYASFLKQYLANFGLEDGFAESNAFGGAGSFLENNVIAASVAFDHFNRELVRPQPGPHYLTDSSARMLTVDDDVPVGVNSPDGKFRQPATAANASGILVTVPNGATGAFHDISFGGHPIENQLADNQGDYDTDYNLNVGSYYDKIHTAILMSESEDRFISQSRGDFVEARYRANGIADLFPNGYRRLLANALTGATWTIAARVEVDENGLPLVNGDNQNNAFPQAAIGWPTASLETPQVSWSRNGGNLLLSHDTAGKVGKSIALDPQIGWEVQKFLVAWSLAYIRSNEKTDWQNMMRVYRIGAESPANPEFEDRIEWHDPATGVVYYAHRYGKECIYGVGATTCTGGDLVERGIAARVLEWANTLTAAGYKLDTAGFPAGPNNVAGYNEYGAAMVLRDTTTGNTHGDPKVNDPGQAYAAKMYRSVPDYLHDMGMLMGAFGTPAERGLF